MYTFQSGYELAYTQLYPNSLTILYLISNYIECYSYRCSFSQELATQPQVAIPLLHFCIIQFCIHYSYMFKKSSVREPRNLEYTCTPIFMYHTREIFGGGKYWRIWQIRGDLPNYYPSNVLVLPSKQLAKVSSPIFYHPKVKEMCIRQYFTPPNISRIRYMCQIAAYCNAKIQLYIHIYFICDTCSAVHVCTYCPNFPTYA